MVEREQSMKRERIASLALGVVIGAGGMALVGYQPRALAQVQPAPVERKAAGIAAIRTDRGEKTIFYRIWDDGTIERGAEGDTWDRVDVPAR
jgi:hypothetical protein